MIVSVSAPRGKGTTEAVRKLTLTAETPGEQVALARFVDAEMQKPRPFEHGGEDGSE